MSRKNKTGLIIFIAVLMFFVTLLLIPFISSVSHLKELKYLVDNGREVSGIIVKYDKTDYGTDHMDFHHQTHPYYQFTLYYRYEEDEDVWETSEYWHISEDKTDELEEFEIWCKNQIGKTVKLKVADSGYCELASELPSKYKSRSKFVWICGGMFAGLETALFISLIAIIFKIKVKQHLSNTL